MTTSSSVPVSNPGIPTWPRDLSRSQVAWLIGMAVLVHALLAWRASTWSVSPAKAAELPAIEVVLLNDAPAVPRAEPTPVQPPTPAQPKAPAPVALPTPVQRAPAPVKQSMLASTKPAQANDMQAPTPAPVTESKPTPVAAAPTPVATPASASTQAAEAVRQAAAPLVLPSLSLRYLVEPKLNYPPVSRELGESGVVKLRVLIDEQGRPTSVTVATTSGFPRLDKEAVRAMNAARFQPRVVDGVPRSVSTIASLEFNLEEQ
ncbi:MAG: energy transducer TonB [Aquabacterium sp.]